MRLFGFRTRFEIHPDDFGQFVFEGEGGVFIGSFSDISGEQAKVDERIGRYGDVHGPAECTLWTKDPWGK